MRPISPAGGRTGVAVGASGTTVVGGGVVGGQHPLRAREWGLLHGPGHAIAVPALLVAERGGAVLPRLAVRRRCRAPTPGRGTRRRCDGRRRRFGHCDGEDVLTADTLGQPALFLLFSTERFQVRNDGIHRSDGPDRPIMEA